MSVIVIAVATESGVPIFIRKRGINENVQFSTIASLHGVNMFSKCHNLSMINTMIDNGVIIWKEFCKSITLIGITTGGLQGDLELLLSYIYDAMILFVGKNELESLKNVDQMKRELRQCYSIIDNLMEAVDANANSSSNPTLTIDLMHTMLCPQAQQLQQALDYYAGCVTGRWACITIHGSIVACSSDFCELTAREARLLLLAAAQNTAPICETPVYLPHTSPNVAFRAVTCKLLADVYVVIVCGATPPLSQIDEIVLRCWEGYAQTIKEAKLVHHRNFPNSVLFEPCVLAVLLVKVDTARCVFSRHTQSPAVKKRGVSGSHRTDILRTFFVTAGRDLAPELRVEHSKSDKERSSALCTETYWCTEYYNCHAQRRDDLLLCALYSNNIPITTMRLITSQTLQDLKTNKDIYW